MYIIFYFEILKSTKGLSFNFVKIFIIHRKFKYFEYK